MKLQYPELNRSFFNTLKGSFFKTICRILGHSFYIRPNGNGIRCDRCGGRVKFSDIERIEEGKGK